MGQDDTARDTVIEVPYTDLSGDALRGLAEAFVLREGTDYGDQTYTLAQKVDHVVAQLRSGEATIVFDPEREAVDIVLRRELRGEAETQRRR